MSDPLDVFVEVPTDEDHDHDDVAELIPGLHSTLNGLDVDDVRRITGPAPDGSKSVGGIATALGIRVAAAGLAATIRRIYRWATAKKCSVEITIDGDTLKIDGASKTQQEALINVWLARHAPGE